MLSLKVVVISFSISLISSISSLFYYGVLNCILHLSSLTEFAMPYNLKSVYSKNIASSSSNMLRLLSDCRLAELVRFIELGRLDSPSFNLTDD